MKIQSVTMLVSVPIQRMSKSKFEPIKLDKSNSINANNYFDAKFKELRESYQKLLRSINGTKSFMNQNFFSTKNREIYFFIKKKINLIG